MKKEEVYLDLTKLTKEQLINVAESVKDEMLDFTYKNMSKGLNVYNYLVFDNYWYRTNGSEYKTKITYNEFLNNFGKMTETEELLEIVDGSITCDTITITLPIEDYNRLRKLEIKQEIKRLKKELKGLL